MRCARAFPPKIIGKEHTESEASEADGSVLSGEDESELEYPSDEGDDESPLDMDMHGDEGACSCIDHSKHTNFCNALLSRLDNALLGLHA